MVCSIMNTVSVDILGLVLNVEAQILVVDALKKSGMKMPRMGMLR